MRPTIIYAAIFLPVLAHAGLKFERDEASAKATPAEEELVIEFPFKNEGDTAVEILDVSYACSCLDAKADKARYAAGEAGVLKAVFKLGSFTGLQRKAITVVSKGEGEDEEQRDRLMVAVTIPDVITIEPELLQWAVGEDPGAKTFTFKVPHEDPIKIKKISCSREGFDFELVEKKPGREYEIKLKPASTASPMLGVLKIETDCAIAKHQRKLAFFSIARQRRR